MAETSDFHIGYEDNVGIIVFADDDTPVLGISWLSPDDAKDETIKSVAGELGRSVIQGASKDETQLCILQWFGPMRPYAAEDCDERQLRRLGIESRGVFDPAACEFDSDTIVALMPDSIGELAKSMDMMIPCTVRHAIVN